MSVTFLGNFGKFNDAIVETTGPWYGLLSPVGVKARTLLEHCSTAHRSVENEDCRYHTQQEQKAQLLQR